MVKKYDNVKNPVYNGALSYYMIIFTLAKETMQTGGNLIVDEIEMRIIFNEGKYNEFKKSKKSPSDFCKSDLKMRDVKSYNYVKNYFEDAEILIGAIQKYHKMSRVQKGEYALLDLVK